VPEQHSVVLIFLIWFWLSHLEIIKEEKGEGIVKV
jgi:hypothetical protein